MLGTSIHRYHRQSPQHTCTAAELGDRRKEDEREGERERSRGWSSVESQGPRSRCQMLTEKVQTLFLAVFELVQAKSRLGRPAPIALDFWSLAAESSSCLQAVKPDWILWRLLRYSKTF